jgi:diguanylate cyclase (GGDEF)-like protein
LTESIDNIELDNKNKEILSNNFDRTYKNLEVRIMSNNNIIESIKITDFLFENLTTAIFLVDKNLKVKKVNSAYKELFAKNEDEVLNKLCGNSIGCSFAEKSGKFCGTIKECEKCSIRNCINNGFKKIEEVQNTYITREFYINGISTMKYFRIKTKYVNYQEEDMAIIAIDDVTELEEEKNRIKEFAQKDYLTGLYNRRYLFEIGEIMFQNAVRGNMNMAFVMIDIDFFKKINDNYGHSAGDFILKSIAEIFKENFRKSDIISRYGGEEFCIILSTKEKKDGFNVMEKIREIVELQSFIYEGIKIPVTISIGVLLEIDETFEESIKRADKLLYEAKKSGRNRVVSN